MKGRLEGLDSASILGLNVDVPPIQLCYIIYIILYIIENNIIFYILILYIIRIC